MAGVIRPAPLATDNVEPGDVATAATRQFKSVGVASQQAGPVFAAVRTVSASTFLASTDRLVRGDTTGGAVTLTLPKASEYVGLEYLIVRSAGANTLTVAARSGDTIDGAASISVTVMRFVHRTGNTAWTSTVIG